VRQEQAIMRMADLKRGWPIVGNDGIRVGAIKEVGQNYLLMSPVHHRHDLYVPASAIAMVRAGSVQLNVDSGAVGELGWELAPRTSDEPTGTEADLHRHV
jgi:hypothetical protein